MSSEPPSFPEQNETPQSSENTDISPITNEGPESEIAYQQPQDVGVAPTGLYGAGHVKTNQLAIWSLITGLLFCFALFCCIPITPILAIVFGHIAISQINSSNGIETGKGMAIAGLVLGYGQMLLYIVWIVVQLVLPFSNFGEFGQFNFNSNEEESQDISELSDKAKEVYRGIVRYSLDNDQMLPGHGDEFDTSNEYFRILFSDEHMTEELPFYSGNVEGSIIPDGLFEGSEALSIGENVFGYVKGTTLDTVNPIMIAPVRKIRQVITMEILSSLTEM